jgi:hypothetical protein
MLSLISFISPDDRYATETVTYSVLKAVTACHHSLILTGGYQFD